MSLRGRVCSPSDFADAKRIDGSAAGDLPARRPADTEAAAGDRGPRPSEPQG